MAAEAEHGLGSPEEFLQRAAGGERRAMAFLSIASEPGRLVILSSLAGGMIVLPGESGLDFYLLPPVLAAAGGTPPASKASIEALKTVEPGEDEGDEEAECSVCLDELWSASGGEAAPAVVREMPCKHRFHGCCIEKWLRMQGSCPVCRHQMPAEPKKGNSSADALERRRAMQFLITITLAGEN